MRDDLVGRSSTPSPRTAGGCSTRAATASGSSAPPARRTRCRSTSASRRWEAPGRRRHPRRRAAARHRARARCPTPCRLSQAALALGAPGVLALPPFYYKGVSDDGLFRFFAELIERVGDDRLRLFLYHIPPQAVLGFSPELIGAAAGRLPGHDRRDEGLRGRRGAHRAHLHGVPAADRVRGHREVPARHAALGRRRLHLGDGQRHRAPGPRGLRPLRRRRGRRAPRRPR